MGFFEVQGKAAPSLNELFIAQAKLELAFPPDHRNLLDRLSLRLVSPFRLRRRVGLRPSQVDAAVRAEGADPFC